MRLEQVTNWLIETKPDVLCLQETKVTDDKFPYESFEQIGYQVAVYGQKAYNGVAIISKIDIENIKLGFEGEIQEDNTSTNLDDQKRIISALINGVRIINVYVPNGSNIPSDKFDFKIAWLERFKNYINKQSLRNELTCITGDFNIAPEDKDVHNPEIYKEKIMASKLEREMLKDIIFGKFTDSFRVFENNAGFWSWWDYRNNAYELNKGWRIDHIYISKNLSSKLKSCVIERNQRENLQPSDHAPVLINLEIDNQNEDYFDDDEDLFEI